MDSTDAPLFDPLTQVDATLLLPSFFKPEHPPDLRTAFRTKLQDGQGLFVFPSVGAIPKHILVAPGNPYYSFAELEDNIRAQALAAVQEVRQAIKDETDKWPLLVENGMTQILSEKLSEEDRAKGAHTACACVDWAHMHIIPVPIDHNDYKMRLLELCWKIGGRHDAVIENHEDIKQFQGTPYLLIAGWRRECFVWTNPRERFQPLHRQFIRRAIWSLFEAKGDVDEAHRLMQTPGEEKWNWRSHPGFDVMRQTQTYLRSLFDEGYRDWRSPPSPLLALRTDARAYGR